VFELQDRIIQEDCPGTEYVTHGEQGAGLAKGKRSGSPLVYEAFSKALELYGHNFDRTICAGPKEADCERALAINPGYTAGALDPGDSRWFDPGPLWLGHRLRPPLTKWSRLRAIAPLLAAPKSSDADMIRGGTPGHSGQHRRGERGRRRKRFALRPQ